MTGEAENKRKYRYRGIHGVMVSYDTYSFFFEKRGAESNILIKSYSIIDISYKILSWIKKLLKPASIVLISSPLITIVWIIWKCRPCIVLRTLVDLAALTTRVL